MADTKPSAFPAAGPLTGAELVPVIQGGANTVAPQSTVAGTLAVDHATTQPATPTAGGVLFTRHRARRLPAFVGPTGLDTALQPALFSNRVARLNAVNNVAAPILDGLAVTNVNTPTGIQNTATSFYTSMVRSRYSSLATGAGLAGGLRSSSAQWFLSSTANMGGFFFVCRFGLGATTVSNRIFVGMSATTGALSATTDPTALLNLFGFGANSAHTTLRVIHNDGSGTATSVDLGGNFPTQTATSNFYEVRLFAPSGGGQVVYWSAQRLNDGAFTQGTITTDLPAVSTMLAAHIHHGNGAQTTAVSIDVQSLYIETDN